MGRLIDENLISSLSKENVDGICNKFEIFIVARDYRRVNKIVSRDSARMEM